MTNERPWPTRTLPRRHSVGRRVTPERLERILDAAVEIALHDGFGAVTMQAVARRADYVRPVVYDCYGTPERILLAALDRELPALTSAVETMMSTISARPAGRHDHLLAVLTDVAAMAYEAPTPWLLLGLRVDGAPDSVRHRVVDVRQTVRKTYELALEASVADLPTPLPDTAALAMLVHGIVDAFIRRIADSPAEHSPDRIRAFVQSLASSITAAANRSAPAGGASQQSS